MTPKERFLAACFREQVDTTPIWFMRQAGRYLPGYREIRKTHEVLEIAKTPSLCEQVTMMPVGELGVDAAVMFADIMLPLEGMGVEFRIEENVGPIISKPIRSLEDVERLKESDPQRDVPFVLEAIRRLRVRLDETDHALVGFSGAPFTLASYMIEGMPSRDFTNTKQMMFDNKDAWTLLMSKLSNMVSKYLSSQVKAGVDAIQLFDSWVGALSKEDYGNFVRPFSKEIFDHLSKDHPGTPKIHFGTNTYHLLESMQGLGDVFSVDWRTSISGARKLLGKVAIQGNLEPAVLLSNNKNGFIAKRAQAVLDDNRGERGHIFNLGHGILRNTPVENAKFVVDYVHKNGV
ncbi:MAG: uroporphyrinogen decarboxylase [Nitrososphaerales archaeon]